MDFSQFQIIKNETQIPEVDIIILSYNNIKVSQSFLEHFKNNFPEINIRIIWIDNGSTDGTVDFLIKSFEENNFNSILVISPDNLGVINGRNLGCEISLSDNKSHYLMYLDNDQYVCPGWLEHHFSILNSGYDLVGVEAWSINKMMMPCRKNDKLSQDFSYVGCGGMLIKKEVIEKIGMFDTIFNPAYFEDPDYNFRAHKAGFKIGWNFKAKIIHMAHQTLGNVNNTEKHMILQNSWNKFKTKWSPKDIPILKQKDLPEFH